MDKENSMDIKLYDFEKRYWQEKEVVKTMLSDDEINRKYELGEARIVTEQGAIKLPLVGELFSEGGKYDRKPIYQRRITWDNKKRSRLIESFIMNVPVPPIFIYEIEYGRYEVMDGLQRISSIMDFYADVYPLEELSEWSELNGRYYSQLPQKIREGIDRRQISMVSLLKESAKNVSQEQQMKRMVFERLNTGGVKLEDQEIRNALYDGGFNQLCKKLSEYETFRKLWGIPVDISKHKKKSEELENLDAVDSLDVAEELASNKLYMRMYDVELVLRFFAMRHLNEFSGHLSEFLDKCLMNGNVLLDKEPEKEKVLRELFFSTVNKAEKIFGNRAFCQFAENHGVYKWSRQQKMIYDALMLALSDFEMDDVSLNNELVVRYMEKQYMKNADLFNGKKQSKNDITKRVDFFQKILDNLVKGKVDE